MPVTDDITMNKMMVAAKQFHEAGNRFIDECGRIAIETKLPLFIITTLINIEIDALKKTFEKARKETA